MKKIKTLFIAICALAMQFLAISPVVQTAAVAETQPTAYTLDFSDADLENKVCSAYVAGSSGKTEEFGAHWKVENDVLTRINDCGGGDVTGNYAVNYLNGCYMRYFELSTKVAYGEMGLTGVVFGKTNLSLRHLGDGNALYFMPDPCVELGGSTITHSVTSSKFAAKTGFYDLKIIVCEDYVKVFVDNVERINKTIPADLLRYGRIGLFTANAAGSFSDGVEIYNLDAHGNRIALESYTAVTGVEVTDKTVEMTLSSEKVKCNYAVQPANATVQDVRFLSLSPDIAVVDSEGYIHPLKAGVTEIEVIALDGGFKNSLIVTVTEVIPELEGVTLDKATGYIESVGGKLYLTASYYPEEAENLGFKWSTSNSRVAIVNNGTVTAMGPGTCVITVKDYYGTYSATCTITVGGATQEEQPEEQGGCNSVIGLDCVSAFVLCAGLAMLKKKEN